MNLIYNYYLGCLNTLESSLKLYLYVAATLLVLADEIIVSSVSDLIKLVVIIYSYCRRIGT
jgi:hypothetical protein